MAVLFELGPVWQQKASLTPQQAGTCAGLACAILVPELIGAIRVMARVENVTQQIVLTVSLPGTPTPQD